MDAIVPEVNGKKLMLNGKVIKEVHANALEAIQKTEIWRRVVSDGNVVDGNYQSFTFNAVEMSIYAWTVRWMTIYGRSWQAAVKIAPVKTYDDTRYLLMTLRPEAYDLLA